MIARKKLKKYLFAKLLKNFQISGKEFREKLLENFENWETF